MKQFRLFSGARTQRPLIISMIVGAMLTVGSMAKAASAAYETVIFGKSGAFYISSEYPPNGNIRFFPSNPRISDLLKKVGLRIKQVNLYNIRANCRLDRRSISETDDFGVVHYINLVNDIDFEGCLPYQGNGEIDNTAFLRGL